MRLADLRTYKLESLFLSTLAILSFFSCFSGIKCPEARTHIIEALGNPRKAQQMGNLIKTLDNPDPEVKWAVAEALRTLDKQK